MNYWAESILLWSAQALFLVAILSIAATAMRRSSAAERHRLWLVGLAAIASLPVANALIEAFPTELPPAEPVRYVSQPLDPVMPPPAIAVAPIAAETTVATPQPVPLSRRFDLVPVLFTLWVVGTLINLSRAVRSYLEAGRLRAAAMFVPTESLRVPAGHSPQVHVPMLAGVFRPMILLPADLANWVGTEEQRAIVLHEVAHFDRRDHFVKLFQTFIGAIFFFHPAVRYALRRMDVERELACDEHVLAAGVCPATYAEVLLKVAERTLMARHRHQLAFHNSGRILERRITMISNYRNTDWKSSKLLRSTRAIAVVALAMLMLPDRAVVSGSGLSVPLRVAAIPVSFGSHQTPPAATQAAVQVRLSGTIYDQRGAVIPGVTVRLHSAANGSVQTTITNAAGQYGFSELNSGRYALNAELPGFSGVGKAIAVQGQSLVEDLVLARQVQSLATLTQTFSLTAQPPAQAPAQGFRLSGTITDQSGAVVPGVMVRLVNPADGSAQTTFTNEAGAYAFRQVSSLQYTLEAALPGFQTHSRQIRMQAQDAVENAVLVMAPVNTQIEVSVSAPQGAPLLPQTGTPGFAVRVGGDIAAPSLISQTKPEFPPNAHARGVQGAVRLLGVIAKDGTVTTLQLDPGFPVTSMELVRAAMEAVKQWRYRPAMLNGQPVEFITRITVNFSMN